MKTKIKALKVKIKTLAAEAAIIRREETAACGRVVDGSGKPVRFDEVELNPDGMFGRVVRKKVAPRVFEHSDRKRVGFDPDLHASLHRHRVCDVRSEQRSNMLAYAFLRGKSYRQAERTAKTPPDWKRVEKIVKDFGSFLYTERAAQSEAFAEWVARAKNSRPGEVAAVSAR